MKTEIKIFKCDICGRNNLLTSHHKFPQTKVNRKIYGKLLNDIRNIQVLCLDCHINKKSGIVTWNEQEFCEALEIEIQDKTERMFDLHREPVNY